MYSATCVEVCSLSDLYNLINRLVTKGCRQSDLAECDFMILNTLNSQTDFVFFCQKLCKLAVGYAVIAATK